MTPKQKCPVCGKLKANVQAHMEAKHPTSQQGLVQPPKPLATRVKVGQLLCYQHDLACPECGNPMVLRPSVFGPGPYYACSTWPACRGAHGAQYDGTPLGIPADQETKRDRVQAHEVFDRLWKRGNMGRWEAYAWMQRTLGLSPDEAHIGRFSSATCKLLILAVFAYLSIMEKNLKDAGDDLVTQTFEDIEEHL